MDPWSSKKSLDSPCKFWLDGVCPKSEEQCEFAHAGFVVKVPKLCKFYYHSVCVKAKACTFQHETYPCTDFPLDQCELGSNCKLSHSPLDDITRPMVKEDLLRKKSCMKDDIEEECDEEERKRLFDELKGMRSKAAKVGIVLGDDYDYDYESLMKRVRRKKNVWLGQEVDFSSYVGPSDGFARSCALGTFSNFCYARNNMAKFEAYEEMERRILRLYNEISIEKYPSLSKHLRILD